VEKLVLALRSVKTEFRLSPSDLEGAVEEALRTLAQPLVPSKSASSVSSGEDEGNPFEDDEERSSPPPTTRLPSVPTISSIPSSSSRPITTVQSSVISTSSLFPDLETQLPSQPSVSYTQTQTQQTHPTTHPQHMYGRAPQQQQGYNYGTPYSYGFNSFVPGTYAGPPGGPGVGGSQNGYGIMPVPGGAYPQAQMSSVAQAPRGPDLFATLDPFAS